jgi:hypothetical protein
MRDMQGRLFDTGPGTFVLRLRSADSLESAEHAVEIPDAVDTRTRAVSAGPGRVPGVGRGVHDDDQPCGDPAGETALVHDGQIDAAALGGVGCADLDTPRAQDQRQRIGEQDRPRHDDSRELSASCHESSDAPDADGCLPPEVEKKVERR